MSKNLTRKGLAFGALLALASTAVAGPAFAGITGTTKVTLAATSGGEVYNVLTGASKTFSLSSVVANSLRGAATTGLKWIVEDASRTVVPSVQNSANAGSVDLGTYSTTTNQRVVDSADFAADITLTTAGAETAARTVKVTAWYDDNNNGSIDNDEYEATQTVNFVAASSVASSVVVTSPIIGDTSFEGYVVTSPVLNYAQSTAPTVATSWQGNANAFAATVSQDATNKRFKFVASRSAVISTITNAASVNTATTAAAHGFAVGEKIKVTNVTDAGSYVLTTGTTGSTLKWSAATLDSTDVAGNAAVEIVAGSYSATPSVGSQEGSKNSFSVAASVADDSTANVVASKDIKVSGNDTDAVTAAVRYETKSASATFAFVDTNDKAVAAGKPVRVTATITSATGVTLNGVAKASGESIDVVTDANGKVKIDVATTSGDASDVIVLTAVAEGVSTTSSTATFNWTATTLSLSDLNNKGTSAVRLIATGGSYTFNLSINDNWGQSVAGAYRFKVAASGNTVSETYHDATAGTATVSVADQKIASGNVSVVVTPQKKNDAGTWQDSTANSALPAAQTFTLIPGTLTNGAITVPADASVASSTADLVAGDTRNSQAAITSVATAPVTINGVISDATTGVVKPGALVTVSGPSTVLFTNDTVSAYGSISFYADATTGAYSVDAISNIAQKESVVTVASLGATKTLKVTFQAAAETVGKTISWTGSATQLPGRTMSVTVKLVDKFGNVVNGGDTTTGGSQVELGYEGPGFVVNDLSTVTELGTDGAYTFRVLLSAEDEGKATFSLKYDPSGDELTSTDVISSSFEVAVGTPVVAPTAAVAGSTGKAYASVSNAAGKTVVIKINGVTKKTFAGTLAKKTVVVYSTAGAKNVSVFVGGSRVATKVVTIK